MVNGKWVVVAKNPVVSKGPLKEWIAFKGDYDEAKRTQWALVRDGYQADVMPESEVKRDGDSKDGDEAEGGEAGDEAEGFDERFAYTWDR
jgi:hypothetical protein